MKIDTKAIRTKLMTERRATQGYKNGDGYYDGVLDTLLEVEKAQKGAPNAR